MRKDGDPAVTAETPDDEVIRQMLADPNLIQRPILAVGDKAIVARPIEKALHLIK